MPPLPGGGAPLVPLVTFSSLSSRAPCRTAGWLHLSCRTAAPLPDWVSASSSSHLGGLSPPSAPCHLPLHPPSSRTGRGGGALRALPPPGWPGGVGEARGSCSGSRDPRAAELPRSLLPAVLVVFTWGVRGVRLTPRSLPRRFPSHFLLLQW